jgi:uncharacterized protein (DUF433 family)
MSFEVRTDPVPLRVDDSGTVRVGDSRVTLDILIGAFNLGASAEEIAEQYPSVRLCDVHSVLGYYLRRQDEVDEYLSSRAADAERLRSEIERRFPPDGIRERLLKRRANKV